MKKLIVSALAALLGFSAQAQGSAAAFTSQNNTEFARTIARKGVQLIDVRTPAEFNAGHIPGAVNMDVNNTIFDKQIDTLDPKRPVAAYCRSGGRSKAAARKLAAQGFQVYELSGGFMNWNGETETR